LIHQLFTILDKVNQHDILLNYKSSNMPYFLITTNLLFSFTAFTPFNTEPHLLLFHHAIQTEVKEHV